jgi:soluble lytic murein transglycosylase
MKRIILSAVVIGMVCGLHYGFAESEREYQLEVARKKVAYKKAKKEYMKKHDRNLYKYYDTIVKASYRFDVSPFLVSAVICAETGVKETTVSHKGAQGIAQIMPSTGKWLAKELDMVYNSSDTEQSILLCTYYLKLNLLRFGGDKKLAVASYNCGAGQAMRYKRIPETRVFVSRVMKCYERYKRVYGHEYEIR